ncbi:MAG: hypothetical protein HY900_04815 [Deltaproteobacteria bacterium]|nr:hypothetical protein [Deltaproteobacteria bacterium]
MHGRITRLAAALLTAAGLVGSGASLAGAVDPKVGEALMHTRQAVSEGHAGRAQGVSEHARQALDIAQGVQDPHATEAVKHLQEAVKAGDAGDAASGSLHAMQAQQHLEQAGG